MATAGLAPMDANHRLDAYFSGLCESLVASLRTVFLEQLEAEREDMRHSFEAELNRVHAEYKDYIDHMPKAGMQSAHDTGHLPVVESVPKPRLPPTPQSVNRRPGLNPPPPAGNKQQDVQHHQIQNNQSQDLIAVERLVLPATRPAMQPGQQMVQAAQQVVQVLHQEAVAQTGAQTHRQVVQPVQHMVQHRPPAPTPAHPTPPPAHRNAFLPMPQASHAPPAVQYPQNTAQQPYFPFHVELGGGQKHQTDSAPTAPCSTMGSPCDNAASHGTLPSTAPACNPPTPQHAQSPPPPAPPVPPATTNGLGEIHEQAMAHAVHQPNYRL